MLAGLRIVVGTASWVAPRLSGELFGVSSRRNPQLPYIARLFGIRDLAMGVGVLAAGADERRLWLQLGVVCDLADALAALAAGRNGELDRRSTVMVTAPAVIASGLGAVALARSSGPAEPPPPGSTS